MLSAGDISGFYNNSDRRQRTVPCLLAYYFSTILITEPILISGMGLAST